MSSEISAGYTVLNSGGFSKIEQVGQFVLERPSSWCLWEPNNTAQIPVDSRYDPKAQSWSKELSPWSVNFPDLGVQMEARLQRNGQIGIFPEHASYLTDIAAWLSSRSTPARVLNLFAFTGLASMVCLKHNAQVTHVDMLKLALDWTRRNAEINGCTSDAHALRLIPDEAVSFLARENRRSSRYDLVIMDPPSFSRISKGKDWELDQVLTTMVQDALSLVEPGGRLYFTCHHGELAGGIVENVIHEFSEKQQDRWTEVKTQSLGLRETHRTRIIPAGFLTRAIR